MSRVFVSPTGVEFEAIDGMTLLESAEFAGVPIASSCRNGTCRTCRVRVTQGQAMHTIEWPGLSAEEKHEGWILPCVARAQTDLRLDVTAG